jgi:phage recombination protein Bet
MPTEALTLPEPVARRGIDEAQWRTLKHSLYPGARDQSIYLVLDYCRARKLDPMKKPVHIVPMEVRIAGTDKTEWRDVVMTSVYEHRVTAQRTGLYMGHSAPVYGPIIDVKGVRAPEYCDMVFYRLHPGTGQTIHFPIRTYFREVVATNRDGRPNARWSRAPVQMLTKNCESAGLREGFPDELGGLHTAEEMEGQRSIDVATVDVTTSDEPALAQPDGYDDWLIDLRATADTGLDPFAQAWKDSPQPQRDYLIATEPEAYEAMKQRAAAVSSPTPTDGE